jgi:hypothetical protein
MKKPSPKAGKNPGMENPYSNLVTKEQMRYLHESMDAMIGGVFALEQLETGEIVVAADQGGRDINTVMENMHAAFAAIKGMYSHRFPGCAVPPLKAEICGETQVYTSGENSRVWSQKPMAPAGAAQLRKAMDLLRQHGKQKNPES